MTCLLFAPGRRGAARRMRGSHGAGVARATSPAGCRTRGSEVRVPAELRARGGRRCLQRLKSLQKTPRPAAPAASARSQAGAGAVPVPRGAGAVFLAVFSQRGVKSVTLCAGGSRPERLLLPPGRSKAHGLAWGEEREQPPGGSGLLTHGSGTAAGGCLSVPGVRGSD